MYLRYALLLIALAAALLWWAGRQRGASGVPGGRLLYQDTARGAPLEKPLYDPELDLTSRPDYLVRSKAGLIPVEVKSSRTPRQPYDSHVYQLAAYCVLVERSYSQRPPYGIIRYPERSFAVEFTAELERELLGLLVDMRAGLGQTEVDRSHQQAARCRACGYRETCDQTL